MHGRREPLSRREVDGLLTGIVGLISLFRVLPTLWAHIICGVDEWEPSAHTDIFSSCGESHDRNNQGQGARPRPWGYVACDPELSWIGVTDTRATVNATKARFRIAKPPKRRNRDFHTFDHTGECGENRGKEEFKLNRTEGVGWRRRQRTLERNLG